jgi:hypothetical protein
MFAARLKKKKNFPILNQALSYETTEECACQPQQYTEVSVPAALHPVRVP